MKQVSAGITAPIGFTANGIAAGIKKSGKKDLALIFSEVPAAAVGMFTTNVFKGAHIILDKMHLKDNRAQAVIVNSGNANCIRTNAGLADAKTMAELAATALGIKDKDILVASTGIIDKKLPIDKIRKSIPQLVRGLSKDKGGNAAQAIMTTDTKPKEIVVRFNVGAKPVIIGAMAKGAGMIFPDLSLSGERHATMLTFITTDAVIEHKALKKVLKDAVEKSFNCISVDAVQSTNDTVLILANGLAENKCIKLNDKAFCAFSSALNFICFELAKMIIKDAEGANKFIQVIVKNAKSPADAKKMAFGIANSVLLKIALFASNENTGRIMAAMGQSGVAFNPKKVEILNDSFKKKEISITVDLKMGGSEAKVFTSDLSYEYVRINAAYN